MGSTPAPRSRLRRPSRTTRAAGTTMASAKAPWMSGATPITRRAAQWFSNLWPHAPSQGRLGLKVTGVPIAGPSTPGPSASTQPLAS